MQQTQISQAWNDDEAPIPQEKQEQNQPDQQQQQNEDIKPEEQIKLDIRSRIKQIRIQPNQAPQIIPGMVSLTTQDTYENLLIQEEIQQAEKNQEQEQEQNQQNQEQEEQKTPEEPAKKEIKKEEEPKRIFNRLPIDLICVIDKSASMRGEKIELVKSTLLYIIEDLLEEGDRLSLVQFNTSAQRLTTLLPLKIENKVLLAETVNNIQAGGGTNIVEGLQAGIKQIQDRQHQNPVTSIFLLSDGLDYKFTKNTQFQNTLQQYTNFTIHTFGYGKDHDPKMMQLIADKKDGSFYFIDQIDQIDEAFVNALAELFSVLCQNVQLSLKIQSPEGQKNNVQPIQIVKTFGNMWQETTSQQEYSVFLQNIISGVSKNYVFEYQIPTISQEVFDEINDGNSHQSIMTLDFSAQMFDSKNPEKKPQPIKFSKQLTVQFIKNDIQELEEDGEVMENYFRVKGAEIMDEGMKQGEQGKVEEGQQLIQSVVDQIEKNEKMKNNENLKKIVEDLQEAKNIMKNKSEFHQKKGKIINMQVAHMKQQGQMLFADDGNDEQLQYKGKKAGYYQNAMQGEMLMKCKRKKK